MFKTSSKTKEPENLEKAYDYAVFLLSLRLRTVGEMRETMKHRGYAESAIEKTIQLLLEQKYLDDQRYAEIFLDNLKKYKSFGFYGIKKKFMEKKLPPQLIDQILEEGYTSEDEIEVAKRFLKKEGFEVKNNHPPADGDEEITYRTFGEESSKSKQKLARKLKARGFRGEVIAKLVF